MPQNQLPDAELQRRWVETWQRACDELERIRRAEPQPLDPKAAIRRIFAGADFPVRHAPTTSGFVEQQAWFARLAESAVEHCATRLPGRTPSNELRRRRGRSFSIGSRTESCLPIPLRRRATSR